MLKADEQCTRARFAWVISLTLAAAACGSAEMPSQSSGVSAPTAGSSSTTNSPSTMTAAGSKAPAAPASGSAGMKAATAAAGGAGSPATAAASGGAGAKASAAAGSGAAGTPASSAAGTSASAAAGKSGSAGGGAATGGATFTAVYNALFSNTAAPGCFGCHSGMMNPALNGNFSMITDKAAAYKGLVASMSSPAGMCKDMTRVTAGDPMKSLLYLKISGSPPCGMKMPPGGMALPADVVTLVKDWIMAGAKDD